ncbi:MAG: type I glyceraldehyde-3-phosphate dehydrogenase, partial [Myxococcota bacterium]
TKIAINGFGRIGRCVTRALFEGGEDDIELVAINDLTDSRVLGHLLKHDSVHRTFGKSVEVGDNAMTIGGKTVKVSAERDPAKLGWGDLGVDIVLECTGIFRTRDKASLHLQAGAKKVIVSAPAKGDDVTVVMGVNEDHYKPEHAIVSCGSCTTNCLAPPAKVLLDNFGIERGMLTTIHSYTNDQALLDVPHRKGNLRRSRAAAENMVPSTTGAAKAIFSIIPELEGKFDGMAVRVPTPNVSLVDLTVTTTEDATVEAVNAAMKKAAESGPLSKVFDYSEVELVSGDYIGNPASSILDGTLTTVLQKRMVKVFAWYDNEWGFSQRMIDLSKMMGASL